MRKILAASCVIVLQFVYLCSVTNAQVLEPKAQLERQTFWVNRDWDWYADNIPLFECPDNDITTTWYYRWELMTRHLTYGSPNSGYSFTEFIDRPFWSGAYGAISCPAGHQLYEARWMRTPVVANDYSRYWFRTPGAQPRNYSTWLADSVWAVHEVHPNEAFVQDLLADLIRNYEGWEARHFVPEVGLFWQTGHDDGMEFNINSRQTRDILRGAPGFRPSFNAYMYADALAIAKIARLAGKEDVATTYEAKATSLKNLVESKLWDARRGFFLQMYRDDEERDGHKIQKLTRTYETGQFAGSEHGRELIGYVPWQFNLPSTDKGFEDSWKYLMDHHYFAADFGPTTVERHDPMFLLQTSCCWWSGQSWPYATSQTLKALANVLQNPAYRDRKNALPVSRNDYVTLLQTYSKSHRKNGRPYLAEALHPDTGSFEGHDGYNHSEHYFHSGFCDLVVTGLVGLRPSDGPQLEIMPIATEDWPWFALDRLQYHGHELTIFWDRDGSRYGKGAGFHVLANGKEIARTDSLKPVVVNLPDAPASAEGPGTTAAALDVNFAVNNDGDYYPQVTATAVQSGTSPAKLIDGNYWYDLHPPNRWTSLGSASAEDTVTIDLGMARPIHTIRLYVLDDGKDIVPPKGYSIRYRDDDESAWKELKTETVLQGSRANTIQIPVTSLRQLEVTFQHAENGRTGLTEIELWGKAERPVSPAPAPKGNLAFRAAGAEYPRLTASHTSRYDRLEMANDGRIAFGATPHNRWTSYESKNTVDWLELEFEEPKQVSRVVALIYDDGGGVQAPLSLKVEWQNGDDWAPVSNLATNPAKPAGGVANTLTFEPVTARKLRVLFENKSNSRSGVTELEVWKE